MQFAEEKEKKEPITMSLRGKPAADAILAQVKEKAKAMTDQGKQPCLAVVRVGEKEDDIAYEKSILRQCEKAGILARSEVLAEDVTQEDLLERLQVLAGDETVHGCMLFRPLPRHLDEAAACNAIPAEKDVDCISEASLARIFTGRKGFAPCTAEACIRLLEHYDYDLTGKRVTVIGRSLVVGKPLAMMLLAKNATVTVCHTKTEKLPWTARQSEILIVAAGKASLVGKECFTPGQTVVDVGIHTDEEGNLCGDVRTAEGMDLVKAISPVPGGVGSVTTALLLEHVVQAAEAQTEAE